MRKITWVSLILIILLLVLPISYLYLLNCGTAFDHFVQLYGAGFLGVLFLIAVVLSIMAWFEEFSGVSRRGKVVSTVNILVLVLIFLLASMILTSLSTARTKARQAHIQASLSSMRSVAEELKASGFGASTNSCNEVGTFFATEKISPLVSSIQKMSEGQVSCFANQNAWAISAEIKPNAAYTSGLFCPSSISPTSFWCVDSTGVFRQVPKSISGPVCSE